MKEKVKVRKIPYRVFLLVGLCVLVSILVVLFSLYTIVDYREESRESAAREAGYSANRVVSQVDERLENLWQYYLKALTDDSITYIMENKLEFSDYDEYKKAQDVMADTNIFGDYINGYTFVNYKTGMCLSNKGMFTVEEMNNKDFVASLFEANNELVDKNYWFYDNESEVVSKVDKRYRVTAETSGLNLVMKLPKYSAKVYAMLIVNVNDSVFEGWITDLLEDLEEIVITDDNGKVIFATDEYFAGTLEGRVFGEGALSPEYITDEDSDGYVMNRCVSSVLNWNYCVYHVVNKQPPAFSTFNIIAGAIIVFVIVLSLCFFAYFLYKPIRKLVKNVSDDTEGVKGNELDYLANRFADIKYDHKQLETRVSKNKKKIQELFELRLIRGEVKSEDEWNEYFSGLAIKPCKYFATAVMVLNLKGEFDTEDNIGEDTICLRIVENIPDELSNLTWMPLVYNACTMFCIFGDDDEELMLNRIMKFHEGIQNYTDKNYGFKILMGVSSTHTDLRHFYAAYRESINALTTEKGEDKADGECKFYLASMTTRSNSFDTSFENQVANAIKAVDKEQCYRTIDDFYRYIGTLTATDDLNYIITRMINAVLDAAQNTGLEYKKVFPDGIRKIYREMLEACEPARVRRYLKYALIDPILEARNASLEDDTKVAIERLEAVIDARGGNVSLTECAGELGVHPTYIWKVLKMERGMAFGEFLEAYKLKKAKEMLLRTNMSINDISEKLGYANPQTFARIFAKETGLSPVKFRKLH